MFEQLQKKSLATAREIQPEPFIAILMAVKNGAHLLPDQLASISAQKHQNWRLFAADDVSSDNSTGLIRTFGDQGNLVTLLDGPGAGCTVNFMNLLNRFEKQTPKDSWLAFSDQDDVWLPDRLSRGVARLQAEPKDIPALYCSRTWVCDANLENLRLSPACPRAPAFKNALVQNIAAGNTLLLNPAAAKLVTKAMRKIGPVVAHDWWVYQLITGAGGTAIYDDVPTLLYRQHTANVIGSSLGLKGSIPRLIMVLRGRYQGWNEINIAALQSVSSYLTKDNRAVLETFYQLRKAPLFARLVGLHKSGLFRQRRLGQVGLWIATILNRI